jgi:hypothetical protein
MLENKAFLTLKIEIRKATLSADFSASVCRGFITPGFWPG